MRRLVKSTIEKNDVEGMDEDGIRQFTHLVSTLRLCSKEDIQNIHDSVFKSQDYEGKTEQFVKVLREKC